MNSGTWGDLTIIDKRLHNHDADGLEYYQCHHYIMISIIIMIPIAASYQPGWWWCLWRRAGQGTGSYCWRRWPPVSRSCRGCEPTGCWSAPWSPSGPAGEGRSPRCRRSGSRSAGRPGTSCTLCCRRHLHGRPSPWESATRGSQRFRSQWKSHSSGWMGHLRTRREEM